jgi:hypothetical protein
MEQTNLKCELCDVGFMLREGCRFVCAECGQEWAFSPIGTNCLLTLRWPTRMDERSHQYREYLDWYKRREEFKAQAGILCGLWSPEQAQQRVALAAMNVALKRAKMESDTRKLSLRHRLRRILGIAPREV